MATRVDKRPAEARDPTGAFAAPPVSAAPEANVALGRYRLLLPIGAGGMGEVWAAEQSGDLGFRRLVAVKLIRTDVGVGESAMRRMLLDEARLASLIHHANVVETLDLGEEAGVVYQVMALIDGAPLLSMLVPDGGDGLPLDLGVAIRIIIDALRGLHAAHELRDDAGDVLGLIHRDVSPENILVGVDGVTKLADFGIAKASGRHGEESVIGTIKGKVNYVAPEQLWGLAPTRRSDLFATGVVLWEVLTGRSLFDAPDGAEGFVARRSLSPMPLRDVAPGVPAPIADVVMKALERRPEDRFGSALEMADALEDALRSTKTAHSTHQDVARCLEERLGPSLAEKRGAIRAARLTSSPRGFPSAAPATSVKTLAMINTAPLPTLAETTDTSTVELETTVRAPDSPDGPESAEPAPSRQRVLALAAAIAIAGISIGTIGLVRRSPPPALVEEPPAPTAVEVPPPTPVTAEPTAAPAQTAASLAAEKAPAAEKETGSEAETASSPAPAPAPAPSTSPAGAARFRPRHPPPAVAPPPEKAASAKRPPLKPHFESPYP
jgi:serine/threonine-protein kinase